MSHWELSETCKMSVRVFMNGLRFGCLRTCVSKFVFVELMHHFCQTGVILTGRLIILMTE